MTANIATQLERLNRDLALYDTNGECPNTELWTWTRHKIDHLVRTTSKADLVEAITQTQADVATASDHLYVAWTIIANAYVNASPGPETGWAAAPAEWREAAERWRDERFHPWLDEHTDTGAEVLD